MANNNSIYPTACSPTMQLTGPFLNMEVCFQLQSMVSQQWHSDVIYYPPFKLVKPYKISHQRHNVGVLVFVGPLNRYLNHAILVLQ
jgi:hypothetical protein